jgi:hypothetical protein
MIHKKDKIVICDHDFKNAIPYGNVDHFCLKCKEFIDPFEWFLMTNFDVVNCTPKKVMEREEKRLNKHIKEEQNYIKQLQTE